MDTVDVGSVQTREELAALSRQPTPRARSTLTFQAETVGA